MKWLSLTALLLITACSTMIWDKDGATQFDFDKDDYRCRQETMTTYSGTAITWSPQVTTTRGYAAPDRNMYQRCMRAYGYTMRGN